jgi:thymidylate synthase (FAD)
MTIIEKGYTISVLDCGYVRYIDHMGSDARIIEAARVSYHSSTKGEEADKKLLFYLWKNKHTSPFEMAKLTLNIKMPIFVMRQYVRHRMQNLNEVSARYTELPDEFYLPQTWRKQDTKNKQGSIDSKELDHYQLSVKLDMAYKHCYNTYQDLIKRGVAKEMARFILPVGIYTEIYACWDMKNLLHFISLRDDAHAQWEIQQYGKAIKEICKQLFPWTIEAYEKFKFELKDAP